MAEKAEPKELFEKYYTIKLDAIALTLKKSINNTEDVQKKVSEYEQQARELDNTLLKSGFYATIPYERFLREQAERVAELLREKRNLQDEEIKKQLNEFKGLYRFLKHARQKAVQLNVLINILVPKNEIPHYAAFVRGFEQSLKKPSNDEIARLLKELCFVEEGDSFIMLGFPVVIEINKRLFVLQKSEYENLISIEDELARVLDKLQAQIALSNIGQGNKEEFQELQETYMNLRNKRDDLLAGMRTFTPEAQ